MSSDLLLYPAILIFLTMVIGLIFTVFEFSRLQKKADKSKLDTESTTDK
jgi:hypothetical protein